MRISLVIAGALSLASIVPAQGPAPDRFEVFPSRSTTFSSDVTFVSRMSFGALAGEALQEYPGNLLRGIARGSGTTCDISAVTYQTQDQNQTTAENYTVIFRTPSATPPAPDATPAGILFQTGTLTLPPGTGTGAIAYMVSTSFATPVSLPCEGGFFLGLSFAPATWSADGQSISCAGYLYPAPFGAPNDLNIFRGDYPRSSTLATNPSLSHSWQIYTNASSVLVVSRNAGRTQRMGMLTTAAQLNIGNEIARFTATTAGATPRATNNRSFGFGGSYPEINTATNYVRPATSVLPITSETYQRHDGLVARVLDTQNIGGTAALFLSSGLSPIPGGVTVAGFSGALYLDPSVLVFVGQTTINSVNNPTTPEGVAEIPLAAEGVLRAGMIGFGLAFQAITVSSTLTNGRMSNAQVVLF